MVTFNIEDDKLVCLFSGRLDTENCTKWEEQLINKVNESNVPVIFNLKKVDYVCSSFLSICIRVIQKVGPENFTITDINPFVKKVFMIAGLDKHLVMK